MYKRNGYWYTDFMFKGQRYVKSLNVSSKSIAKELEEKFKTEVRGGEYQKQQSMKKMNVKFSSAMADYLEKESILKKSTARDISSSRHLIAYFGNMALTAITPETVTGYKLKRRYEVIERRKKEVERLKKKIRTEYDKQRYKVKAEAKTSFSTINRELSTLKRLFFWYIENKRTKIDNPVSGVEFFREQSRERVMTDEEEKLFFTIGTPKPHVRSIIILLLSTGMRVGEVLNLKREDIYIGDLGGQLVLRDTKNGDTRKIPLTKELTTLLKEVICISSSDYVFAGKNGRPYTSIKTAFNKTCQRAGIVGLRLHDLRHTFCTRMADAGVNPFSIMRIVGHKDTETAKRYTNPTDEQLMTAMSKLASKSHQFSQQEEVAEEEELKTKVKSIAPVAQLG